ncbi:hypothetical protein [Saccharothrix australiensis]|uniref:Uncharacterized protein n=1 Tax=Saccharothrix australiensis TaxID=2072 RepID=A0A495W5V2_9PSEU|nr:hypothetical protein [Saccharothrix australiensis]RKT56447.1 hypothetical protein C8E97_5146 [Saccharothrix australiensis]
MSIATRLPAVAGVAALCLSLMSGTATAESTPAPPQEPAWPAAASAYQGEWKEFGRYEKAIHCIAVGAGYKAAGRWKEYRCVPKGRKMWVLYYR